MIRVVDFGALVEIIAEDVVILLGVGVLLR